MKFRALFDEKAPGELGATRYRYVQLPDGSRRRLGNEEQAGQSMLPKGSRLFTTTDLRSQGFRQNTTVSYTFQGKEYHPGAEMN